jgi:hypothetical protein
VIGNSAMRDYKDDNVASVPERKIDKISNKIDRLQWLVIIGTLTILFKDYIAKLF